jgi:hypothetical protein
LERDVPYYLLEREGGALFAMNVAPSGEEARERGRGKAAAVAAVCVWTGAAGIAEFREFLEATRREGHAPCRGWVHAMRAGEVDEVALDAAQLRDRLGRHRTAGYVAVDPGPERRVRRTEEFLAALSD